MKKTLIASAVAAATLSSTAFAMDPATDIAERLDSMPTIYGNLQLAWGSVETDNGTMELTENEFIDNGSTLGFKHEHAISDDLTGFFKAEFEFQGDDESSSSGIDTLDEAYLGVKGDFGSVQVGSDETVYQWVDIMDMYEFAGLEGEILALKEGDNFQYVSPDLGGIEVGVTLPIDSDSNFGGAIAAKFALDIVEVVATYGLGREEGSVGNELETGDAFGLAVSVGIDDLSLGLQYESKDEDTLNGTDQGNDTDYLGFLAQYGLGASNFALGYQMLDVDGADEEETGIYAQALHNLSDHMYVYVEYFSRSDVDGVDGSDEDTLAIGAAYNF